MSKKFNIGDRVRITDATNPNNDVEREIAWIFSMDKFKGQTVTIYGIIENYSFNAGKKLDNYLIAEDNEDHFWSPIWFSKPASELKSFLQHLGDDKTA